MSNLQIKNIPDRLHEDLRRRAEQSGMSLRDYVLKLIQRDLMLPSREEWFARLRERPSVPAAQAAAEIIAEEREERDGRS